MADTPKRRARRQFTDEFKASAVRLVLDEGKTVGAAARDLDLTETALREWVKRARADRTHGRTGLTTAEREELARLRKEVRDSRGGARDPKKSRGLLREAEPVRFRFIAAEKAAHSVTILCRCCRSRAAASTRGSAARNRPTPAAIASCACSCGRRTTPVDGPTAGRASGRISSRRASGSVRSASGA